jgi:peptidoglycan-associated lipoprotein
MVKNFFFGILMVGLFIGGGCRLALGQSSGTNSASQSKASSSSGSSSNLSYTNNSVSEVPPMLLNSVPGAAGETIPGPVLPNGKPQGYAPPILANLPLSYLKAMGRGVKRRYIHYQLVGKVPERGRPMHLLHWSPYVGFWPGDRIIAVAVVRGRPFYPVEPYLMQALYEIARRTGTDRCSVIYQNLNQVLTINKASGIGGSGAGTGLPGGNATGFSFVFGHYHGQSGTGDVTYPLFRVVCLNDGPTGIPPSLRPSPPPPPTPHVSARPPEEPQVIVPQKPPVPMPAEQPQPSVQPPSAPSCDAPHFKVLFAFDKSTVSPHYLGEIRKAAAWVDGHPACRLVINGNTDAVGSRNYNLILGFNRALAVFRIMVADGGKTVAAHVRISTSGKTYATGNAANSRNAILEVLGPQPGH